jgi:hypothetical protein
LQNIPIVEKKSNKYQIIGWFLIFIAGAAGTWDGYGKISGIKKYETDMNKRIYSPCSAIDEIGDSKYTTTTSWHEDDPELKGFPREEETGKYLPIKDKNGKIKEPPTSFLGEIKDQHIAFLRGFSYEDEYGVSGCESCSKAKTPEEISICNDKEAYYKINKEYKIDDLDDVDPSLISKDNTKNNSQEDSKGY